MSNLWRYPQTPFLTAALQNSCVFGIGGIPYQKTKICPSCFPPALSRSGGLAEVRPLPKVSTPRPQLKSRRPIKSPRLIIIGALNPILRHPVSACHASQLPAIINQQKQYPYMDRHCRSGLLEQRIETTFQVVSILIGWAAAHQPETLHLFFRRKSRRRLQSSTCFCFDRFARPFWLV